MAKYKLIINKVSVPANGGQGFAEGKLELRVKARVNSNDQELEKQIPDDKGFYQVKPGGDAWWPGSPIGELTELNSKVHRTVHVSVVEVDEGTLGQDDTGAKDLVFALEPGMKPTSKTARISLHRPKMKNPLGKVYVTIRAEQI